MSRPLYALTLWRPWAALIVRGWIVNVATVGFKTIENRTWAPPPEQLQPGQWFAIHAGKTLDADCEDFAIGNGVPPAFFRDPANFVESAIVGVARYAGSVTESDDRWFVGPVGWRMDARVRIEPVPCRGRQKLWQVPDDCRCARARALPGGGADGGA